MSAIERLLSSELAKDNHLHASTLNTAQSVRLGEFSSCFLCDRIILNFAHLGPRIRYRSARGNRVERVQSFNVGMKLALTNP